MQAFVLFITSTVLALNHSQQYSFTYFTVLKLPVIDALQV